MLPLMHDDIDIPHPDKILQELLSKHMKASNGRIVDLEKCWIVGLANQVLQSRSPIEMFFSEVHSEVGSLKAGTFFHWGRGCFSLHDLARQWHESLFVPAHFAISPTWVHGWTQLKVIGPNSLSAAMIQSGIMLDGLLSFWEGHASFGISDDKDNRTHFQTLIIGRETLHAVMLRQMVVIAYVSDEAWIQEVEHGTPLHECTDRHGLPAADYNAIGKLHENHRIEANNILFHDLPPIVRPEVWPVELGKACGFSESKIIFDFERDTAHVIFRPQLESNVSWRVLSSLWDRSQQDWWTSVGRTVQVEVDEHQGHVHATLQPGGSNMPLPLSESIIVFMTAGLKAMLSAFSGLPGITQVPIQLKWLNAVCWEGSLPDFFDMSFFRTTVGFFMSPWNQQQEVNFVCFGKRICDMSLGDLMNMKPANSKKSHIVIVAHPMISGGGPTNAKKDWDINIRNQLAAALLPHGVNVALLPQMTETIS